MEAAGAMMRGLETCRQAKHSATATDNLYRHGCRYSCTQRSKYTCTHDNLRHMV
jgi:hypothetical protein